MTHIIYYPGAIKRVIMQTINAKRAAECKKRHRRAKVMHRPDKEEHKFGLPAKEELM